MSAEEPPIPAWPGPARALVDIYPRAPTTHLQVVSELTDLVSLHDLNILNLGPPLRIHLPVDALVPILDAIAYERIRILQWPYSLDRDRIEPRRPPS